jgi:hypothetical protein
VYKGRIRKRRDIQDLLYHDVGLLDLIKMQQNLVFDQE